MHGGLATFNLASIGVTCFLYCYYKEIPLELGRIRTVDIAVVDALL